MDRIICPFEVKAGPYSEDGCITGYGAVFGNVDSYGDIVAKGAFKKTLEESKGGAKSWPAMLLQHGGDSATDQMPVGIWTKMEEDENGLLMEGKLALNTTRGADTHALLSMLPRPALNGLSIGYRCTDFQLHGKADKARRTIKAADLVEVSLVTFPANTKATVLSVKSELNTIREFENWLRDAGSFSIAQAKAIAANGYKAIADFRDENGEADLSAQLKQLVDMFSSK